MSDIFDDTESLASKAWSKAVKGEGLNADEAQTLSVHASRCSEWGRLLREDQRRCRNEIVVAAIQLIESLESRIEHVCNINRDVYIRRTLKDAFGEYVAGRAMALHEAYGESAVAVVGSPVEGTLLKPRVGHEQIGQRVIDAIVTGKLIRSECPDSPESPVLTVWAENAAEQIGAVASE